MILFLSILIQSSMVFYCFLMVFLLSSENNSTLIKIFSRSISSSRSILYQWMKYLILLYNYYYNSSSISYTNKYIKNWMNWSMGNWTLFSVLNIYSLICWNLSFWYSFCKDSMISSISCLLIIIKLLIFNLIMFYQKLEK